MVALNILPKTQWENPYFADYPEHLLSVPEGLELIDTKYNITQNMGGEYRYSLDYDAHIPLNEFVEYYETNYGKESDFNIDEGSISWEKEGYIIMANYYDDYNQVYTSVTRYE